MAKFQAIKDGFESLFGRNVCTTNTVKAARVVLISHYHHQSLDQLPPPMVALFLPAGEQAGQGVMHFHFFSFLPSS